MFLLAWPGRLLGRGHEPGPLSHDLDIGSPARLFRPGSAAVTPLLAEVFGYGGSLVCCLWSFARTRRIMLMVQMAGSACFLLHWLFQGQATAATMTALLLGIAALSLHLEGPPDSPRLRLVRRLYIAALLPIALLTAMTWTGAPSLFAAIGTAIGCYGRWQTDPDRHRAILLTSSVPWMLHSALVGSVPGVCTDLFALGRAAWLGLAQRRARAGQPVPVYRSGSATTAQACMDRQW